MSDFDNNPYSANNVTDDYGFQHQAPVNVPDYLIHSVLATIFCCQLFGILAIVFSALASGEKSSGNYQKAVSYANNAKICLIVCVVCGVLTWLCMISFLILPIMLQSMQ
ncbi:MAG: CD225/dispanin family protein [Planctomycetaceae bacterium]|nr:CD225/dispanin family protein [Planctomycetaceae bacterium]